MVTDTNQTAHATVEQVINSPLVNLLPPQGMSRAKDILPLLPFEKSTLWLWVKQGKFPRPVKLTPTMTAFRNADVIAWLESHHANADQQSTENTKQQSVHAARHEAKNRNGELSEV